MTESSTQPQPKSQPPKIELTESAQKRNKRFDDFDVFYKKSKEIFEPYKTKGEREQYYEALYQLAVCPGSRMGGRESRVVEFFWGNRLFDKTEGLSPDLRREVKFESEAGATMFFFKNDDGYVSIQLYPAHTENRRPIEDFIFWKLRVEPSCLLKSRFQKHCWKAFMAYMEVTSLDGAPSLYQKVYVWYLRHFKNVVVGKKETPVKALSFFKKVGTWVMTVGFSGLVIFLLQMWLQPNPAEHENVKEIANSISNIESNVEQLKSGIERIESNQDSIIQFRNDFLQGIVKKGMK